MAAINVIHVMILPHLGHCCTLGAMTQLGREVLHPETGPTGRVWHRPTGTAGTCRGGWGRMPGVTHAPPQGSFHLPDKSPSSSPSLQIPPNRKLSASSKPPMLAQYAV